MVGPTSAQTTTNLHHSGCHQIFFVATIDPRVKSQLQAIIHFSLLAPLYLIGNHTTTNYWKSKKKKNKCNLTNWQ